jgi:hypothetical protein
MERLRMASRAACMAVRMAQSRLGGQSLGCRGGRAYTGN